MTAAMAALRPVWASEMTSYTPSSPRARSDRRTARQNASVSASRHPADDLPAAGLMDAVGDHQGLVADPTRVRGPAPPWRPATGTDSTGQGTLPEHRDLLVQAATQPGDLILAL